MVGPNGLVAGKVRLLGWVTQQKAVAMTGRQRSCAQVADNPVPLPITVLQRTARAAWAVKEEIVLLARREQHSLAQEGLHLCRADAKACTAFCLWADALFQHSDLTDRTYG